MNKCFFDILYTFAFAVLLFVMNSCMNSTENNQQMSVVDKNQRKESVEKANRYVVIQENEAINDYIGRHNLYVVETGTGLRYCIVKQGDTKEIERGDVVEMEYEVSLLTGDVLYSSKEYGPKVFLVGKGGVESGLEEAMQHLHNGDVAEIIIPSHLAHGLLGDGNKVPPRATLVYKVKITKTNSKLYQNYKLN